MTSVLHPQFAPATPRRATTAPPSRCQRSKLALPKRRFSAGAAVAQRGRFRSSSTEEKTFAPAATAAPLLLATTTPQRGVLGGLRGWARGESEGTSGGSGGSPKPLLPSSGTFLLLAPARSDTPRHTLPVRQRGRGVFAAAVAFTAADSTRFPPGAVSFRAARARRADGRVCLSSFMSWRGLFPRRALLSSEVGGSAFEIVARAAGCLATFPARESGRGAFTTALFAVVCFSPLG